MLNIVGPQKINNAVVKYFTLGANDEDLVEKLNQIEKPNSIHENFKSSKWYCRL